MGRPTKEADREYRRAYRARKKAERLAILGEPNGGILPGMPGLEEALDDKLREVQRFAAHPRSDAVKLELARLDAVDRWPVESACCLTLAELLDHPSQATQHPNAAAKLADMITTLRTRATAQSEQTVEVTEEEADDDQAVSFRPALRSV